ncbi:MAG: type II and III secretion system protein [Puniceicoccales bacterium]|jgi:general secretion pathway protein D|nr:type II and III secretion system protein [Puniceicoccales bacterium]
MWFKYFLFLLAVGGIFFRGILDGRSKNSRGIRGARPKNSKSDVAELTTPEKTMESKKLFLATTVAKDQVTATPKVDSKKQAIQSSEVAEQLPVETPQLTNHLESNVDKGKDIEREKEDDSIKISARRVNYLILKARSLLLVNNFEEAHEIAQTILKNDPKNKEAIAIETCIKQRQLESNEKFPSKATEARESLLKNIQNTWETPKIVLENIQSQEEDEEWSDIFRRLNRIIIPKISFNNTPLSQAINTIVALSEQCDSEQNTQNKGVNMIVMTTPNTPEPNITLNLKNMSLDKILNFIAKSSAYQFDIEDDVIVFRKMEGGLSEILETKIFKISRSAIVRMTGIQSNRSDSSNSKKKKEDNSSNTIAEEERLIKEFLQKAGVNFTGISGSNLAFDGSQLIITQSLRNMKRVKEILNKYEQVKQVEIETKFIEVQQNQLDELQFGWNLGFAWKDADGGVKSNRAITLTTHNEGKDNLRNLTNAFTISSASGGDGSIVSTAATAPTDSTTANNREIKIPNPSPSSPGGLNLGATAIDLGIFKGVISDKINLGLTLRALEQQANSDLMSAPKVTVLSGKTAKIVVAQEFIYPKTWGQISSAVGTGDATAAGVTITAGTPSDFETRNVGVEMNVTPTVEESNCISLQLKPKVTEFEGFIEYGGRSIAIQGNTTVQLPPGFYQPIFSTREIETEVTIYDGATVIMGGLTHEEIKEVKDKVPLLGDIPLLGRLFRSKGETVQKKNLLIFVTANILSPGGTPVRTKNKERKKEPIYRTSKENL